jgi:diguanylate cyclase (GGDEF)-like protein
MTVVNVVIVGAHMGTVWAVNRPVPGFLRCGISIIILGFGMLGAWLRLSMTGSLVILVPTTMLVIGSIEMAQGLRQFRGLRPVPQAPLTAVYVGFFLFMVYFLYVHDDFALRACVSSMVIGAASVVSAGALAGHARRRGERALLWPAAAGYVVHSCTLFAWAVIVGTGHGGTRLFVNNPGQLLFVASGEITLIFVGFGLSSVINLRLRQAVEDLAHYDSLTHLPNRRLFDRRFDEACRAALRQGRRLALVYMDLDDFKIVNDTLGHTAGDEALALVAARLKSVIGHEDCLARLGGDEFVLLLHNADSDAEVEEQVQHLREAVAGDVVIAGRRVRLGVSCGYALSAEAPESYYDLVRRADAAMYDVKRRKDTAGLGPALAQGSSA